MKLSKTIHKIRKTLFIQKGKTIGLIPTMGYIHEGHLSLVEQSKKENDLTIVSIFVNPTQFERKEDFDSYPIELEKDMELLKQHGVDILFHPNKEEIYLEGESTRIDITALSTILEGFYRPGHFVGVCTVILKLFNIIKPTTAYFGEKDFQQVKVIQQMVKDLFLDVKIIACPILREKDGLAMSSRNANLSIESRKESVVIHQSLLNAKKNIKNGNNNSNKILEQMKQFITKNSPLAKIDYISINSEKSLEEVLIIQEEGAIISMAVFYGSVRLIDNMKVDI